MQARERDSMDVPVSAGDNAKEEHSILPKEKQLSIFALAQSSCLLFLWLC